jgi:2-iminobutanoate/2-iminopropanoate deaminase
MEKKIILTNTAPAPIGPYSQAVMVGNTLYCSGQIALNAKGELVMNNIQEQVKQVMHNIGELLKSAQMDYSNIVKTSIFLTDMNDFAKVNEVYATYFTSNFPARETIQVSALPKNVNVEISVIAVAN